MKRRKLQTLNFRKIQLYSISSIPPIRFDISFDSRSASLSKLISLSSPSHNNLKLSTCSCRVPFNSALSCFSLVVSFELNRLPVISYVSALTEFNATICWLWSSHQHLRPHQKTYLPPLPYTCSPLMQSCIGGKQINRAIYTRKNKTRLT